MKEAESYILKVRSETMKKLWSKILLLLLFLACAIIILIPVLQEIKLGLDLQGGFEILYSIEPLDEDEEVDDDMVTATYKTLTKRIDVLGILEPTISIEGDKIRVQLAGIDNADEAREVLSQTASLTFRDTDDNLLMTSDVLTSGGAKVSQDDSGNPVVALSIKDRDEFYEQTKKVSEMDDNRIVIWLDFDSATDSFSSEEASCGSLSDSRCLSVATVSQGFSSDVIIQGDFDEEEVENLVDLINSGSMPAKLVEVSSKSVEASFGANSLEKTVTAGVVGITLICLLLILIYRTAGLLASVGIIIYSSLTFFIFWLINGTLTLPGIAAVIIGISMAVDSNVISFSRIKEELYKGKSVSSAFKYGNKTSFKTILDANITTFIVAIILFIFGESSVRGFATMLIISVFSTMIVMVFFVRWIMRKFVNTKVFEDKPKLFIGVNPKDIPNVDKGEKRTKYFYQNVDFVSKRKIFLSIAAIVAIVGLVFLGIKGLNLGVDFRGGTAVTIQTEESLSESTLTDDIASLGYESYNFEVQSNDTYTIRIDDILDKEETDTVKEYFDNKYSASTDIGVISDIVKNELIQNAIISLILASLAIVIYISLRFKFSYGVSCIVALLLNVLVTVALFSIFRLEVSTIFIAAILSIIGYSVNDIIITFDRIRENVAKRKKIKNIDTYNELVNTSLREVFNRSIITNVTTLIPVIALIFLGAYDIINFNIALLFGIIVGTLSSIFMASQLWLEIEKRNVKKGKKDKKRWYEVEDEIDELNVKGINS